MTIEFREVAASAKAARAWDRWLIEHGAADFQQFWDYGAALEGPSLRPRRLQLMRGPECIGQAQIMVRQFGPVRPQFLVRGPVLENGLDMQQLSALFDGLSRPWRGRPLFWNPPGPDTLNTPWRRVITGESEARLALHEDADVLRKQLKQKWRHALHQAERTHMVVSTHGPGTTMARELEAREDTQRKNRNYRGLAPHLPALMARGEGCSKAVYFQTHAAENLLSEASFIHAGDVAYYFSGWTSAMGRKANAQHKLLFEACQRFAAKGAVALHLGSLDSVNSPGLARFKLGLGAQVIVAPGTYV